MLLQIGRSLHSCLNPLFSLYKNTVSTLSSLVETRCRISDASAKNALPTITQPVPINTQPPFNWLETCNIGEVVQEHIDHVDPRCEPWENGEAPISSSEKQIEHEVVVNHEMIWFAVWMHVLMLVINLHCFSLGMAVLCCDRYTCFVWF